MLDFIVKNVAPVSTRNGNFVFAIAFLPHF